MMRPTSPSVPARAYPGTVGNDPDVVRRYHEATKHTVARLGAAPHLLDWPNRPSPWKIYRGLPAVALPQEIPSEEVSTLRALALAAEGVPAARSLDLAGLARVLHLAAGVTKVRRHPGGAIAFRAAATTGALYHLDLYVVAGRLPGLPAGVYHHDPRRPGLDRLREGDHRGVLAAAAGDPTLGEAAAIVVAASTWWRNAWKYRARTWRHVFWDAGTMHANLTAAAASAGLGPRIVLGFADRTVCLLLGLDQEREGPVALVPLGRGEPAPPAPPLRPLEATVEPSSPRETVYPEIVEAQRASELATGDDARRWRGTAQRLRLPSDSPSEELVPLVPAPDAVLAEEALERTVSRRGSTRRFDPTASLRLEELSTVLDLAFRPVVGDHHPTDRTLVEGWVVAHAVDGLAPGVYRYRPARVALEPVASDADRAVTGRIALFQDLGAASAAAVFCLADLDAILDRLGARGYRAAQFDGGLVGGRLYLGAYALRLGATGLTFLDDEVVTALHAEGREVMFLTALGRSHPALRG